MRNLFLCLILYFASTNFVYSQDKITKVLKPQEVSAEIESSKSPPKEFEGLVWNRWTSKNFIVCSLNDSQAQYLHKHLELVKSWIFSRWGMADIDFSVPCKLICVDGKDLFKKLFSIENTKVEVRRNSDGLITETVIFLLIEGPPSQTIPIPLTQVCLTELGQKNYKVFNPWVVRGMAHINGTLEQIRKNILNVKPLLEKNEPLFYSKALLELTSEQYGSLNNDQKNIFDSCSIIFCLMIRKEFGQDVYLKFLHKSTEDNPEDAVKEILKFSSYDQLDKTFKRYMIDLTNDIYNSKTPDDYLQVNNKKR